MKTNSASIPVLKKQASRLRKCLSEEGLEISNSKSLELLSQTLGFRDWNTLSAVSSKQEKVYICLVSSARDEESKENTQIIGRSLFLFTAEKPEDCKGKCIEALQKMHSKKSEIKGLEGTNYWLHLTFEINTVVPSEPVGLYEEFRKIEGVDASMNRSLLGLLGSKNDGFECWSTSEDGEPQDPIFTI